MATGNSSHISSYFDENETTKYFGTVKYFILIFYNTTYYNLAFVEWHTFHTNNNSKNTIINLDKMYKTGHFINIAEINDKVIFVPYGTDKRKAIIAYCSPKTSK